MKHQLACLLLICASLMGCSTEETCEAEAGMVTLSANGVKFMIDTYEASRINATSATAGTGVTRACNYGNSLPWNNVTYEDALNACLDAGKRLCTKDEWMAACGAAYPYGATYQSGVCNDSNGIETSQTGAKSGCKTSAGVYDMSGNVAEWVEGGTLMGGGYNSSSTEVMCTSAKVMGANTTSVSQNMGFRCCMDVSTL